MKYLEALDFIEECNKAGIVPGLESITELCKRLNNPQDQLRFIHIAGTNGKGSTLAYISTILKNAGYKTGRYVSPTIRSYLERFQINGRQMSQAMFGELAEKVKKVCDEMVAEGLPHPTSFEVETAIAFLFFLEKNCDIVVLECGMGGRFDATNIIKTSVLEVFAHIDMDHMQFLGDTLEKIAYEKAGIIKPSTTVVSTVQYPEVEQVLVSSCEEIGASLYILKEENISKRRYSMSGQSFTLDTDVISGTFKTPLLGTCQIENAATAVLAVGILKKILSVPCETSGQTTGTLAADLKINDKKIAAGLLATEWPARLQILNKKPLFVIDGAHNPDAARRLREAVDLYFADKKKIYIFGMFRDKAVDEVIDIMCHDADMIMTVATPGNPRALSSFELAELVRATNPNVTSLDSVEEAVEMAMMFADSDTLILSFGSLAYLGRIIDIFDKR